MIRKRTWSRSSSVLSEQSTNIPAATVTDGKRHTAADHHQQHDGNPVAPIATQSASVLGPNALDVGRQFISALQHRLVVRMYYYQKWYQVTATILRRKHQLRRIRKAANINLVKRSLMCWMQSAFHVQKMRKARRLERHTSRQHLHRRLETWIRFCHWMRRRRHQLQGLDTIRRIATLSVEMKALSKWMAFPQFMEGKRWVRQKLQFAFANAVLASAFRRLRRQTHLRRTRIVKLPVLSNRILRRLMAGTWRRWHYHVVRQQRVKLVEQLNLRRVASAYLAKWQRHKKLLHALTLIAEWSNRRLLKTKFHQWQRRVFDVLRAIRMEQGVFVRTLQTYFDRWTQFPEQQTLKRLHTADSPIQRLAACRYRDPVRYLNSRKRLEMSQSPRSAASSSSHEEALHENEDSAAKEDFPASSFSVAHHNTDVPAPPTTSIAMLKKLLDDEGDAWSPEGGGKDSDEGTPVARVVRLYGPSEVTASTGNIMMVPPTAATTAASIPQPLCAVRRLMDDIAMMDEGDKSLADAVEQFTLKSYHRTETHAGGDTSSEHCPREALHQLPHVAPKVSRRRF